MVDGNPGHRREQEMLSRMSEAINTLAVGSPTDSEHVQQGVKRQKYLTCSKIAALSSGATMTFFF